MSDVSLASLPLGAFAVELGAATVNSCQGPLEGFAFSLEHLTAPPRHVACFRLAPFCELRLAYVRDSIAFVSDLVALVRDPLPPVCHPVSFIRAPLSLVGNALALVGHRVSFVHATVSLIKPAAPFFQSGGLRTGAPSSVTSPLGDSTFLGGLIASSALLASVSVLLSQTSATFEHFGRAHKDLEQAPRVRRWTH